MIGGTWLVVTGGAVLPFSDESVVRAYVLDNADDPASVEFDRWGPDDTEGRLAAAVAEHGTAAVVPFSFGPQAKAWFPPGSLVVRVRYREKNRFGAKMLVDELYSVKDRKVVFHMANFGGDQWLEKMPRPWEAAAP
jgi:hypothetical protein